jgi:predicted amidohydrolase
MKPLIPLLIIMILFVVPGVVSADDGALFVLAVQWEMRQQYAYDQEIFFSDAVQAIEDGLDDRSDGETTLILFPEYTSVFLSLDTFAPIISQSTGFLSAWAQIQQQYGYASIPEMLKAQSVHSYEMLSRWQELARTYESYIIPGTLFVYDEQLGHLVNRWVLISPEGHIITYQDKVYCTPFETDYCGVQAGLLSDASPFEIEGTKIAVTICRDTFFDSWEALFGEVDLWVDLKANGVVYDAQQEQLFAEAVPERVEESGSRYGLTLCLTGSFLELFWEGVSSVVNTEGETLIAVSSEDSLGLLSFLIP